MNSLGARSTATSGNAAIPLFRPGHELIGAMILAANVAAIDGDLLAAGSVFVWTGQRTVAIGAVVVARAIVTLAWHVLLALLVLMFSFVIFFLHYLAAEVAIFVDAALNFRLHDQR